jgi:bacillithiol system protein YtxJ
MPTSSPDPAASPEPSASPEPAGGASSPSRDLAESGVLETALEADLALIYKYSPICPLSDHASAHIRRFMEVHPDLPVYDVDVIRGRPASQEVERRLGIRHQSPQAILIRRGEPLWDGSHMGVDVRSLEQALQAARSPGG